MKLHANAPLGPKGRRDLVERVLEEGLVAHGGGRGRRSERERPPASGRAATAPKARPACSIAAPRPGTVHNATPHERVEAIAALRRVRMTGPEIAEALEMATSTVSAVLSGSGWAGSAAWSPLSRPAATSAPAPAS